jgi:transcriptional regulator with XRE-family HTH domain
MIREARKSKGLTLKQVAGAARMPIAQLSDIERGAHPCPLHRVPALAAALGVQVDGMLAWWFAETLKAAGIGSIVVRHVARDADSDIFDHHIVRIGIQLTKPEDP